MEFQNKTVVITGAAVGIGYATAIKFAQNGAKLALIDINSEMLEKTKEQCLALTDNVITFQCDISRQNDVEDTFGKIYECFGQVDVLVNNAALWRDSVCFLDLSAELFEKYLSINVMGVFHCIKAVLGSMIDRKYGKIINVASVAGVYGNKNMSHYSATKGAVISLTKALAKEVAEYGISVNAVSPGTVNSAEDRDWNSYQPNDMCYFERTGTAMENAELIYFLSTDKASYISGQNIQIDGCRKRL